MILKEKVRRETAKVKHEKEKMRSMLKLSHKKLDVWKNSIGSVVEIYKLTGTFPKSEIYELTNQLRRASVSIPSNIAEGLLVVQKKNENDSMRLQGLHLLRWALNWKFLID